MQGLYKLLKCQYLRRSCQFKGHGAGQGGKISVLGTFFTKFVSTLLLNKLLLFSAATKDDIFNIYCILAKKNTYYNQIFERVEITGVAAEGKAITRVNDLVVFVPLGAPGDVVDIRIRKAYRRYLEAEVIRIHSASPSRVQPFCEHFGVCGGCKWQHLDYPLQLHYKQQQVEDSILRIAKVSPGTFQMIPIAGSDPTRFYRNKLEFTFSNKRWLSAQDIQEPDKVINDPWALGFHIPGFFDKVLDIRKCWLQPDPSNPIRLAVKDFALKHGMSFYDLRQHSGLLRSLVIRTSPKGETMVIVVFAEDRPKQRKLLMDFLAASFDIHSLIYVINDKKNPSFHDLETVVYSGRSYIVEEMEGLQFYIGPKSFFQTNSHQALTLYRIARDFAGLSGREVVYDLYTGTGTIANFVASSAAKVIGIEYVEEAVAHARTNSELNGIANTHFLAGDMAKVFDEQLMDKYGYPHVIITDPPRAGMDASVLRQIIRSGADRIVYVSCNPATQARDIALLAENYDLKMLQAVDMFPHTQHVESVALLVRKGL